jgi:hypothetical protein
MHWTPLLLATCTMIGSADATPKRRVAPKPAAKTADAPNKASGGGCASGKKYVLGPAQVYPGHGVMAVAIADINGDGKADIVTGNPHGTKPAKPHLSNIGVMLGKGDGTFADVKLTPVGGDPSKGLMASANRVTLADLDGDKRPDIVFSAPGWGMADPLYALNAGDGTFAENMSLHAPDVAGAALVLDLNGDGKNDIVMHNVLWLNSGQSGAAMFAGKVKFIDDGEAEAAGDFDGNGSPDIVATSYDGVTIYVNDGNASFTKGTKIAIEDTVHAGVGDFNGDGKPDIAIVAKSSFAIVLNKGSGKFAAPVYYKLPEFFSASFITVTDLDGDGKADVVFPGSDNLAVYLNDGSGVMRAPMTVAAGKPYMVATGDLTGDHVQSLIVVDDSESSDEDKSHIYVLRASCR